VVLRLAVIILMAIPVAGTPDQAAAPESTTGPVGIATFECVGLYWHPSGGGEEIPCNVVYREPGAAQWHEALPLWYDTRNGEYRGSLVNLKPGATYETRLSLGGTGSGESITVTTWKEDFPIARTVHLPHGSSAEPYTVVQGGTAEGYVLYTSAPNGWTTINVADRSENCVKVRASYVIVRGLMLKGAQRDGIHLQDVHDVVIEENDISGWGRKNRLGFGKNEDAGIRGSGQLQRIVIQRNKIHHPRYDSSNWEEENVQGSHPIGPQGIVFGENAGNHVFRHNEIYSDEDHCFNDGMGHWRNFSTNGFPGPDTDVYGNIVRDVWDDALEIEGGGRNVRVWGNYLDQTYVGIATTACSVGPLYIFRNVMARSRVAPGDPDAKGRGVFGKLGDKTSYGAGRQYWLHNTVLQPELPGCEMPLGVITCLAAWGGPFTETVSHNNIWHTYTSARGKSIWAGNASKRNTFDYDLCNNRVLAYEGAEPHRIEGVPVYAPGNGPASGSGGMYQLDRSSPGHDGGIVIPNFNDDYEGTAPDVGAHEAGSPRMEFGVEAHMPAR